MRYIKKFLFQGSLSRRYISRKKSSTREEKVENIFLIRLFLCYLQRLVRIKNIKNVVFVWDHVTVRLNQVESRMSGESEMDQQ